VLMPRYYVPLTVKGRICMMLNLHRGWMGILPKWAIRLGNLARSRYHSAKQRFRRCSSTAEQSNRNRQVECANPPAGSTSLNPSSFQVAQERNELAKES